MAEIDDKSQCQDRYISPVDSNVLLESHRNRSFDPGTQKLLEKEFAFIGNWLSRKGGHRHPSLDGSSKDFGTLMGLAFSGGGIRSATFSLGVMQALAKRNLMDKFDYVSTVSGGGYIGSSLTWWLSAKSGHPKESPSFGLGEGDFPFGTDDPSFDPNKEQKDTSCQRNALRYLRQHGNYLTPGRGLDLAAAIATVIRSVFLNVTFWFLLALTLQWAVLSVGGRGGTAVRSAIGSNAPFVFLNGWIYSELTRPTCPAAASCVAPCAASACPSTSETLLQAQGGSSAFGFDVLLWVLIAIGLVAILAALAYSFATYFLFRNSAYRYKFRRRYEKLSGKFGKVAAFLAVAGSLPLVSALLGSWVTETGVAGILTGAVSALGAFLSSRRAGGATIPFAWQASIGSVALIYGGFIVTYLIACKLLGTTPSGINHSYDLVALGISVFVVVLYGYFVNVNYVTLHRFYRDRLMEAFLPDANKINERDAPAAQRANKANLTDVWDKEKPASPYQLINCNIVLVDSTDRTRELRGGDAFVLSPLYCGSSATGWQPTRQFAGGALTLATAVAISGAAANPNTGCGGRGPTRSRSVSLLMTAFGLGLGCWLKNPDRKLAPKAWRCPNHLRPVLSAALSRSLREDSGYVELSDGGHFENLALYELIRRRLRLIVLCDGASDPKYSFADLQVAIRRIERDFGARIDFDKQNRLKEVMPSIDMSYPPDTKASKRGYVVAKITYCDGSSGVLIYLKTTMIKNLSLKTKGYKNEHRAFPDQTTADQFFDEDQFEAYRELGYRLASKMADSVRYHRRSTAADDYACKNLGELIAWIEQGHLNSPPAP